MSIAKASRASNQATSVLPTSQIIDNKYAVIELTPAQRHYLNTRHLFHPVQQPVLAQLVSDDPHAMTISIGTTISPDGREEDYRTTERVPGVLVQSESFVSGFFHGMVGAYDDSESGEQPMSERDVVAAFTEVASNAVTMGDADMPVEFSAGFLFGYVHGVSMIGTPAYATWAKVDGCVAVQSR